MPQVRKLACLLFLCLVYLAVATGCGKPNPQAKFDPDDATEGHPAHWLPGGHADAADDDIDNCRDCHGDTLSGGIARVACIDCHLGSSTDIHPLAWDDLVSARHGNFVVAVGNVSCAVASCHGIELEGIDESGPACTSCHLGGVDLAHPLDWGDFTYAKHGIYVGLNGADSCANTACHGADLDGMTESGPSCTSCHMGGIYSAHPLNWDTDIELHGDYVAHNGTSACRNQVCHGPTLQGVVLSGMTCNVCHAFF